MHWTVGIVGIKERKYAQVMLSCYWSYITCHVHEWASLTILFTLVIKPIILLDTSLFYDFIVLIITLIHPSYSKLA